MASRGSRSAGEGYGEMLLEHGVEPAPLLGLVVGVDDGLFDEFVKLGRRQGFEASRSSQWRLGCACHGSACAGSQPRSCPRAGLSQIEASRNARSTVLMRVWYPGPCALNHSSTSWSTRSEMEALDGNGCRPRRTTPRTMWRMSASGCSSVGVPGLATALRRTQSVLDFIEEDECFTIGRFAERDDADFMFVLRVND